MGFFDSEGASAEDMVTDADMAEEVRWRAPGERRFICDGTKEQGR